MNESNIVLDPDRPGLRDRLVAGSAELPLGPIRPARWNAPSRRLRPRFVAAGVIVAVASYGILATGVLAAASSLPGLVVSVLGILSVAVALTALFAAWPDRRVSPFPRILLGIGLSTAILTVGSVLAMAG